jgi:chromosome segregation ATPase
MLLFVIGVWYVLTALSFFVLFDFGWKSVIWVYYVKDDSVIALYLISSLGMLFGGYALRYWELSEWKRELEGWEKRLKKWIKEFKRLKVQKEEYERVVRSLSDKKSVLMKEIDDLSHRKEILKGELRRLQKEVGDLGRKVREAEERGYQDGYNRVIHELRSLRAQKTAILNLFDSFYELRKLIKEKTGMDIRRYLNSVRKKVKEGYDATV